MKTRILMVFAAAMLALTAMNANAALITVGDQDYNIETVEGPGLDFAELFQAQAWYGNQSLAANFAAALGDQLGYPNEITNFFGTTRTVSPLFVWDVDPGLSFRGETIAGGVYAGSFSPAPNTSYVFATASVPAPGMLALMGLGLLGFVAARRRTS